MRKRVGKRTLSPTIPPKVTFVPPLPITLSNGGHSEANLTQFNPVLFGLLWLGLGVEPGQQAEHGKGGECVNGFFIVILRRDMKNTVFLRRTQGFEVRMVDQ